MRSMADVFTQINQRTPHLLLQFEAGQNNWTCKEQVQSWIDNLTETELVTRASESSSPTKSSFDSDVFLQCPSADDLVLGAEARYYGSCSIVSPRLSPLITSFIEKDNSVEDGENLSSKEQEQAEKSSDHDETSSPSTSHAGPTKLLDQILLDRKMDSLEESKPEVEITKKKHPKLDEKLSSSSWASSFDNPSSLAAAFYTDPEELLFSLGFCHDLSFLDTIPERFFQNESQAKGINVAQIRDGYIMELEESQYSSYEESVSNPILQRFSESSVDLNSHTSSDSIRANRRRILFSSSSKDIPSIHLSRDENDRSLSPLSVATSSSNNWMKLETLEEVPEPTSRSGSFESDRLTNEAIAAFLAASKERLETAVDQQSFSSFRRLSELSQMDTMSSSYNSEEPKRWEGFEGEAKAQHLHMPLLYKRSNSDKSISSVVTVINTDKPEKKQHSFSRTSTLKQYSVNSESNAPHCEAFAEKSAFQPVAEQKYIRGQHSSDVNSDESKADSTSLSSSRRTLFRTSKHSKVDLSDNVFDSTDSASALKVDQTQDISADNISYESHEKSTDSSFNESFKDFVEKLRTDEEKKVIDEKPCVEIVITPAENLGDADMFLTSFDEKNTESTNAVIDPELHSNTFEEHVTASEEQVYKESSSPKKYFSAAINSLAKVFGKYQDSKTSECTDDIHPNSEPVKEHSISPGKKRKSKIFKLFNHQTFASHSNSAFSSVATGLINGEVELDQEDEAWAHQYNPFSRRAQPNELYESDELPEVQGCSRISDSSMERNRSSALGYVADSASSDDCNCPKVDTRKKRNNIKKLTKGHSMESSGFDDELIKCPLGKNCSIVHFTGNDKNGDADLNSCDIGKAHGNEVTGKKKCNEGESSTNVDRRMTHEHFDYLVQQFTSLRAEMKSEFAKVEQRELEMETSLKQEVQETKSFLTSEYMNWIIREMNSLKLRLQEKDEEIRRLRDLVCEKRNSKDEIHDELQS